MIVDALIWLAVAGLTGIGVGAVLAPVMLSRLYGAAVDDPNAIVFVRAAGIRDVLLAGVLAFAQARAFAPVVHVALAAGGLLALGDFGLTLQAAGWHVRREHLTHLGGFVGFAIIAFLAMRQ